ncbi:conserved hypothetical protein [Bradyrhizobium sp. STM 3843]|nr:conserved hypothetical protein [Bradyrhizobium sp. STM 3843]
MGPHLLNPAWASNYPEHSQYEHARLLNMEMSMSADRASLPHRDTLDATADQVIAACDGDVRAAVCALIVAKGFLETELMKSMRQTRGEYPRGRVKSSEGG